MGIVVSIAMLAGLCIFLINPVSIFRSLPSNNFKVHFLVGFFLGAAGLWNAFWYGLRNVDSFWGQAALVSGLIMLVSALVVLMSLRRPAEIVERRWFHWLLIAGLLASFLLYATTLVQLNLGIQILR